jgi:hypothetical protein
MRAATLKREVRHAEKESAILRARLVMAALAFVDDTAEDFAGSSSNRFLTDSPVFARLHEAARRYRHAAQAEERARQSASQNRKGAA